MQLHRHSICPSLLSHSQFKIQDLIKRFDPYMLMMSWWCTFWCLLSCWGNSTMLLLQCFTRLYSGIQILIISCKVVLISWQKDDGVGQGANVHMGCLDSSSDDGRLMVFYGWKMVLETFVVVFPTDTELKLLSSSLLEGAMCYWQWNPCTKAFARLFLFWMLYLIRKVCGQQKWTCYI